MANKNSVNNPDWREASIIPDSLVSTDEIVDKTVQIHFFSDGDMTPERIEAIFAQGLTVDPHRVSAVCVTETIKTTFRMSRTK
jgi:hypothetical protein